MRIASRVDGLHPGRATLPSGRKYPSVFILLLYYYIICSVGIIA